MVIGSCNNKKKNLSCCLSQNCMTSLQYPPSSQSMHAIPRHISTSAVCIGKKDTRQHTNISRLPSTHKQDHDIKMQELALSIQLLRDPKQYKEFMTMNGSNTNSKLLADAKMVMEYYANANAVLPLKGKDENRDPRKSLAIMSGPELCHLLMSNVILPHYAQGERVTAKQLQCILHLCFLTVQSLGKLCIKYNRQRGWSNKGNEEGIIHFGDLAEQLLRQLLNTPFTIIINQEPNTTNVNKVKGRMSKVTHLYNNTLNTWSCIAATSMNATLAKEAALRAERLLLDLATSRNRGKAQTFGNDGDDKKCTHEDAKASKDTTLTLLEYLKPDVVSFNTTINAWSKSGRFERNVHGRKVDLTTISAAERAEAILHLLQDLYDQSRDFEKNDDDDDCAILPDVLSYEAVIYAWSRAVDYPHAPVRATRVLEDMVERYYRAYAEDNVRSTTYLSKNPHRPPFPSRRTFSSVLNTWARSSSMTGSSGRNNERAGDEIIEQAEKMFSQMKKLGQGGYEQNNPDTISYNALLQVYTNQIENVLQRNEMPSSIGEAVGLFQRMVNILDEMDADNPANSGMKITQVDFQPDSTTYKLLLRSIVSIASKILSAKKYETSGAMSLDDCSQHASSFLQRMSHFPMQEFLHKQSMNDLFTLFLATNNLEGIKAAFTLLSMTKLGLKESKQITGDYLEALLETISGGTVQKRAPVAELVSAMEKYICNNLQKDFGIQPTTRMWNCLIEAYSKLASSHINYAWDADRILMHVLHKYKEALEAISNKNANSEHFQVARPNTFTFHSVLAAYAKACNKNELPNKSRMMSLERMEEIISIMEDMNKEKQKIQSTVDVQVINYTALVTPNTKTYNVLLSAYDNSMKYIKDMNNAIHMFGKAEKVVKNMSKNVITGQNTLAKPDNYTYAILLGILAKTKSSNAPGKAREILNTALDVGLDKFDTIIVNNVMNIISSRENCSKDLLEMFQQLESESFVCKSGKIKPDKFTYSIVMSSLANEGTIDAAKSVETLYSRMLDKFKAEKHVREARKIQPDIYCYNAIIKAWSNIHTTESLMRAEIHLDRLLTTRSSVEPDSSSFSVVIHGHSKRLEPNAAADCERVLDKKEKYQQQNQRILINVDDYRITAQKYRKEFNPQGCRRILERLLRIMKEDQSSNFTNTHQLTSVFNTVMESYFESSTENASSKVQEIFDLMDVQGLATPDRISYSILMKSYANNDLPLDSLRTIDEILEKFLSGNKLSTKVRPEQTAVLFNILFQACNLSPPFTSANSVTIAFKRFNQMTSSDSKLKPTQDTYEHMFAICKNHIQNESKRYELLKQLLQKCCADGQLSEKALSVLRDAMPIDQFDEVVSVILGRKMNARCDVQITDFPQSCRQNVLECNDTTKGIGCS